MCLVYLELRTGDVIGHFSGLLINAIMLSQAEGGHARVE